MVKRWTYTSAQIHEATPTPVAAWHAAVRALLAQDATPPEWAAWAWAEEETARAVALADQRVGQTERYPAS